MSYTQEQIDEALILAMDADQKEIERLRAEVLEQCRLNGMGSEREARLMAQLTERDDELNRIGHQLHQMAVDLAESQAREQVLREAMSLAGTGACSCLTKTPDPLYHKPHCRYRVLEEALAIPADHTALDALLKAERAKERGRIAAHFSVEYGGTVLAGDEIEAKIRALEDE